MASQSAYLLWVHDLELLRFSNKDHEELGHSASTHNNCQHEHCSNARRVLLHLFLSACLLRQLQLLFHHLFGRLGRCTYALRGSFVGGRVYCGQWTTWILSKNTTPQSHEFHVKLYSLALGATVARSYALRAQLLHPSPLPDVPRPRTLPRECAPKTRPPLCGRTMVTASVCDH